MPPVAAVGAPPARVETAVAERKMEPHAPQVPVEVGHIGADLEAIGDGHRFRGDSQPVNDDHTQFG
jgi:hypothetical protein